MVRLVIRRESSCRNGRIKPPVMRASDAPIWCWWPGHISRRLKHREHYCTLLISNHYYTYQYRSTQATYETKHHIQKCRKFAQIAMIFNGAVALPGIQARSIAPPRRVYFRGGHDRDAEDRLGVGGTFTPHLSFSLWSFFHHPHPTDTQIRLNITLIM